jgi:hypothetical protein
MTESRYYVSRYFQWSTYLASSQLQNAGDSFGYVEWFASDVDLISVLAFFAVVLR